MNAAIPAFESDRSAQTAHASLRRSLKIADQAQHSAVLWFGEILRRKLFRELGYSSMRQYAEQSLGFSRSKTGDFLRLASKLEELPVLKKSVAEGDVPYTKARELIKVARAKTEQFTRYEALWERLHKLGGVPAGANRADVLLQALAGRIEELECGTSNTATASGTTNSTTGATRVAGPAAVIHIHECPACGQASVQTSAGEKRLSAADLERAREDATIIEAGKRTRRTIPPKTRTEVLQRDRHRCQNPGCTHTRFLELHHKRPVSRGGTNDAGNLITLCGACHRLLHKANEARRPIGISDRVPSG